MHPLARLDAYGSDDPDNNEGFIEDRCSMSRLESRRGRVRANASPTSNSLA